MNLDDLHDAQYQMMKDYHSLLVAIRDEDLTGERIFTEIEALVGPRNHRCCSHCGLTELYTHCGHSRAFGCDMRDWG